VAHSTVADSAAKAVLTFTSLLLVTGCVMHAIPNPSPVSPQIAADLTASQPVSVINAQPATEEVSIGRAGMGKMRGNLREWTDAAVTLLSAELQKRSVSVADNAPKTLKLAVTGARLQSRPMGASCSVDLCVETGDGQSINLSASASGMQPPKAADGAVSEVVAEILRNRAIQEYLAK